MLNLNNAVGLVNIIFFVIKVLLHHSVKRKDFVVKIIAKKTAASNYKKGYPILSSNLINYDYQHEDQGKIVQLLDDKGHFIANAYIGLENKGLGWVFSTNKSQMLDNAFISKKLNAAITKRTNFFNDTLTNAFRLFNGYGDGIGGITVDYYAGYLLINWYNEGIYKYRDLFIQNLIFLVEPKGIYQKFRFKQENYLADDEHIYGQKTPESFFILENGIKYCVDFEDGNMVGIFLDQRHVRKMLTSNFSQGKTVLNTFSYTGAFSIAALAGSAKSTTSVDLAKRSLPKTTDNLKINNFATDQEEIIVEDVFNYFKYALRKEHVFDIAILDPPSFAKSKKRSFSVLKDYSDIVQMITPLVAKNGYIIASTNNSQLPLEKFKYMVEKGIVDHNRSFEIKQIFRLPPDFSVNSAYPQGNYLKVILLKLD